MINNQNYEFEYTTDENDDITEKYIPVEASYALTIHKA